MRNNQNTNDTKIADIHCIMWVCLWNTLTVLLSPSNNTQTHYTIVQLLYKQINTVSSQHFSSWESTQMECPIQSVVTFLPLLMPIHISAAEVIGDTVTVISLITIQWKLYNSPSHITVMYSQSMQQCDCNTISCHLLYACRQNFTRRTMRMCICVL